MNSIAFKRIKNITYSKLKDQLDGAGVCLDSSASVSDLTAKAFILISAPALQSTPRKMNRKY